MSIPAHTNAVGTHLLWDVVTSVHDGYEWNWSEDRHQPYHREYQYGVLREKSVKPPSVKGDRKSVYPYHRGVYKVMKDLPAKIREYEFNDALGKVQYDVTWDAFISLDHGPFNYNPINGPLWENAKQESIVRALNNLAEHKAQIVANLAQARQTVDLFAVNAKRGMDFLRFLRGKKREAIQRLFRATSKRALKDRSRQAADLWIEFQYGWKPLASDIYESQQAVLKAIEKGGTIRSSGKGKYSKESEFDFRNETWKVFSDADWKTHIVAKVENPNSHIVDSLGLINPATVIWELVPWSFAFDWFVPVGATLEACSATVGLQFVRGWQSAKHRYLLDASRKVRQESWNFECVSGGNYVEEGFEFWREYLGAFPIPQFYADLTPFSTTRSLNALALFRQQMKG